MLRDFEEALAGDDDQRGHDDLRADDGHEAGHLAAGALLPAERLLRVIVLGGQVGSGQHAQEESDAQVADHQVQRELAVRVPALGAERDDQEDEQVDDEAEDEHAPDQHAQPHPGHQVVARRERCVGHRCAVDQPSAHQDVADIARRWAGRRREQRLVHLRPRRLVGDLAQDGARLLQLPAQLHRVEYDAQAGQVIAVAVPVVTRRLKAVRVPALPPSS